MHSFDKIQYVDENYFNLFHAMPYPMAVFHGADGNIYMANRRFCNDFGLPAENTFEEEGAGCGNIPPDPSHEGEVLKGYCLFVIDDDTIQLEARDGIKSRVKATVQPVRYNGQECWLATPSESFRFEASIDADLNTGKRYRDLVENLNDILYTTDENATVTYVSPNISQLSGYTPCEVIGRNFTEFVHPDDLPGRIEQFLKILNGANQATEYRLFTKTGEAKWTRTSARPIWRNGKVVGVQGILVDISDRKAIEEELIRSEEKYRILVQHAKDAIFVIQNDHIKIMNPSASDMVGYTCESISQRKFWEFIHPDDRTEVLERYRLFMRGENLSDRIEFRIVTGNGEIRDMDLNAVAITWEGQPAVLNFVRDITIQKKMEAQLRNSQKMEALGTLAGGIAHNFNNLLMGIQGNASLSLLETDQSAATCDYLNHIIALVQSGSKLTNQLLDYARNRNLEISAVNINRLVVDASDTVTAIKKTIQIHHKLSKNMPLIKADHGQLEQVILNLLLNAADAMPHGGDVSVETSLMTEHPLKEKSALSHDQNYVLLKVTDCGTGISPDIKDRIFEPFFTTKFLGQGTGLGLSTAYGIVKNHGGEIHVESEVNQGSSFFVYLPALPAKQTESVPTVDPEKVIGKRTILFVDDEPQIIETSSKLLEVWGFKVLKASEAEVALEIFHENWQEVDLVVLDLILPNMSGKDLFYKLKEIDPKARVLLSSGLSQSSQAKKLLCDGCCGFIQKPYDIRQLSEKMMEILSTN